MERNVNCPKCGATMEQQGNTPQYECPYCNEQTFLFEDKKVEKQILPTPPPVSEPTSAAEPEVKYVYVDKPTYTPATPRKSKSTTLLLCFFLGGFGIHHFYLGHIFKGILYVILVFIFWPIPCVLSLIDFITYLFRDENNF